MNISVVMAAYNGAQFIEGQIASISNQTLKPDELIVCDDQSTDSTALILKKNADEGKLNFEVNAHQLGVIRNFKKACALAKPENWVALSDQDDIWMNDKLERSALLLDKINDETRPCIVYSDLILIDENGKVLEQSFQDIFGFKKYSHTLKSLVFSNFVTGCTILMNTTARRWFLEMPDDIRSHDEWLALIAFTFGKAAMTKTATVNYRKHQANVSLPTGFGKTDRLKNLWDQLFSTINGKDDFLKRQFIVIEKFYGYYKAQIEDDKKLIFENFLKLKYEPYLLKKAAYRQMIKQNRLLP